MSSTDDVNDADRFEEEKRPQSTTPPNRQSALTSNLRHAALSATPSATTSPVSQRGRARGGGVAVAAAASRGGGAAVRGQLPRDPVQEVCPVAAPAPSLESTHVRLTSPAASKVAKVEIPADVQQFAARWMMGAGAVQTCKEYAVASGSLGHYAFLSFVARNSSTAGSAIPAVNTPAIDMITAIRRESSVVAHATRMYNDIMSSIRFIAQHMYSTYRTPSRLFVRVCDDADARDVGSNPVVSLPCRVLRVYERGVQAPKRVLIVPILISAEDGAPVYAVSAPPTRTGAHVSIPVDTEGGLRTQCLLESMIPVAAIDALALSPHGDAHARSRAPDHHAELVQYTPDMDPNGVTFTLDIDCIVYVLGTMSSFGSLRDGLGDVTQAGAARRSTFLEFVLGQVSDARAASASSMATRAGDPEPIAVRVASISRGESPASEPLRRYELVMTTRLLRAYRNTRIMLHPHMPDNARSSDRVLAVCNGTERIRCAWDAFVVNPVPLLDIALTKENHKLSAVLHVPQ